MTNVLMIIAPKDYRDEELLDTQEELEKAGNYTVVASTNKGIIFGSHGGSVEAEVLLSDVDTQIYDSVVFVGGAGANVLFENADALRIAKEMYDSGKIVSAICIAPVILANAGLLEGKQATVFADGIEMIESKGAKYTGLGITVDDRIVTANGPKQAHAFGQKIAELLD